MVAIDTLEGLIDGVWHYHYDVGNDVLYVKHRAKIARPAYGDPTDADDLVIEMRDEDTDELIGLTVVGWWKRYGRGELPDSIRQIQAHIEPWAAKVAA